MKRNNRSIAKVFSDASFLRLLHWFEGTVAKILSIALVIVIFFSLFDLGFNVIRELSTEPIGFFQSTVLEIFGLFLNILIALELLENIQAYLDHQGVQVQLVVATALIAVARKLIIFDFAKSSGLDLVGLAVAIFSLSISYWLVRQHKQ
ncbi:phosphate-starvation-inducible PsiE family protein [Acaryochloris sp. 'Moss Beach']|uniref:phosphate-starvation-inducible PsiE family protein n=1 Tax=Acaryochloris TaxID=155977 RepID=UPI001BB0A21E|nr:MULTISPECIES: phosphate-starvation-inducible PsiE family protein [Acaryochloris]QUY42220.1 phosphate-starvation-inducible PsiE family protein [Acaryochloris marina S15]UJB71330.1 phosphate-starvation-inducible PsiE family protein [Acaryochloris sp. 'Moss Beach']